jgi:hypothetical protein
MSESIPWNFITAAQGREDRPVVGIFSLRRISVVQSPARIAETSAAPPVRALRLQNRKS